MKILFVSEFWYPQLNGGGEISGKYLTENLASLGIQVHVLTSTIAGLEKISEQNQVIIHRCINTGHGLSSIWSNFQRLRYHSSLQRELTELLKQHQFDLIHFLNMTSLPQHLLRIPTVATVNSPLAFCPKGNLLYQDKIICDGCRPLKFLKCIQHSHSVGHLNLYWYFKYNPLFLWIVYRRYYWIKNRLHLVTKLFARSQFVVNMLIQQTHTSQNIFIERNLYKEQKNTEFLAPITNNPRFVFVGSLEPFKGIKLLVEAFCSINLPATLTIAGHGSYASHLSALQHPNIQYVGKISHDESCALIAQADVVCQTSILAESFSRVMLEALCLGKPILATRVGGNLDGIINGSNGILVDPSEVGIRQGLEWMMKHRYDWEHMGRKSREIFEQEFSPKHVLNKIIEQYKSLISSQGQPSS